MHGDIVSQFVITAHHVDERSDLAAAVHVLVQSALRFEALEATEGHVFADLADEVLTHGFQSLAVHFESGESGNVGGVLFSDKLGGIGSHLLEFGVLRDEVGFGVDFEDRGGLRIGSNVDGNHAFGGHAGSSLARLVAELHAQDFFSLSGVALRFRERLLAFHHRGVGLFTKRLHHRGSNNSHS